MSTKEKCANCKKRNCKCVECSFCPNIMHENDIEFCIDCGFDVCENCYGEHKCTGDNE